MICKFCQQLTRPVNYFTKQCETCKVAYSVTQTNSYYRQVYYLPDDHDCFCLSMDLIDKETTIWIKTGPKYNKPFKIKDIWPDLHPNDAPNWTNKLRKLIVFL